MDLNSLPIFAMMNKRMGWLTKRQEILAQNIANSDTPGYRPSDLAKQKFRDMLRASSNTSIHLQKTSGAHIDVSRKASQFRNAPTKDTYETAPDGNSVVVEEQLMKVSETEASYRLATNLYSKHVKMIKIALGKDR